MILRGIYRDRNSGVTVVELLIVIGVTIILAAATIPIYSSLQVSAHLNENSSQLIQTLRLARERAVAGFNNRTHGVQFQSDRYILFENNPGTNFDRETELDGALILSWDLSDGSDEVSFLKGIGTPSATGSINIIHNVQGARTITINSFGVVEED